MKSLLLIVDGASDIPLCELDGRTPLEAACLPQLSYLRLHGRAGRLNTAVSGFPLESTVCTLRLLGYDPARWYPGGRASFEAIGQGVQLGPRDLVLRCNLVSLVRLGPCATDLRLTDFTAGDISSAKARAVLATLRVPPSWELYPGQGYRNLLVLRNILPPAPASAPVFAPASGPAAYEPELSVDRGLAQSLIQELICAEPHQHVGDVLASLWPSGRLGQRLGERPAKPPDKRQGKPVEEGAQMLATQLRAWMISSIRPGSREKELIMPWVWSHSLTPDLPSFEAMHGVRGAIIAGLDFIRGIGKVAGMLVPRITGATGEVDSDLAAKAQAAICAWDEVDMVVVHVNAADEAAHQRDVWRKIHTLEAADRVVLGPLLAHLARHKRETGEGYRVLVCADHPTLCCDGTHSASPPFWVLYDALLPDSLPAVSPCVLPKRSPHKVPPIIFGTPPCSLSGTPPSPQSGTHWEQALDAVCALDVSAVELLTAASLERGISV